GEDRQDHAVDRPPEAHAGRREEADGGAAGQQDEPIVEAQIGRVESRSKATRTRGCAVAHRDAPRRVRANGHPVSGDRRAVDRLPDAIVPLSFVLTIASYAPCCWSR